MMKKLIAVVLLFLGCMCVDALPVDNPSGASLYSTGLFFSGSCCNPCDPCCCWIDSWSLRTGFYGDYVFNRNLKIAGEGLNQGKSIRQTELVTNAGYLALNICNKLDFFGTLGASKIRFQTTEASWFLNGTADGILETEDYFSWSAGARAALFSWHCFGLGIEGQYFRVSVPFHWYWNSASGQFTYFNDNEHMVYQEWQVGLGLSYVIGSLCPNMSLVPYGAAKWSWVRFDTHRFTFIETTSGELFRIFNLKSNQLWGYAVGMTLTMHDVIGVTVEGRWADEKAIYVNGQLRF